MAGRESAFDFRGSPARGRQTPRRPGEGTPKAPRAFADPLRLPARWCFQAAKRRRLPAADQGSIEEKQPPSPRGAAGGAAEILPIGRHPLAEVSFVWLSCDAFQGESEGANRYGKFFAASGRFDPACLRN